MQFGVGIPSVGPFADPRLLVRLAGEAEASGWNGFFIWDHLLYVNPFPAAIEPWSVLAAASTTTQPIRLGVLVTAVARRPPVLLAQQVATVDRLSGGRTIFGAGLGSRAHEFERLGMSADGRERGRRLDEGLSLLQKLWAPGLVRHRGEFYTADEVDLAPKPLQQPHPPIWIGGQRPNRAPFRRAARFEGVVPIHASYSYDSFMRPDELSRIIDSVRDRRVGEQPIEVVMEAMSRGPEELHDLAIEYQKVGLRWWIEKLGWWRGKGDVAAERIRAGPPR